MSVNITSIAVQSRETSIIKPSANTTGDNFTQVLNSQTSRHNQDPKTDHNAQSKDNPQTEQITLQQPTKEQPNVPEQAVADEISNLIIDNAMVIMPEGGLVTDVPLADIAAIVPGVDIDVEMTIMDNAPVVAVEIAPEATEEVVLSEVLMEIDSEEAVVEGSVPEIKDPVAMASSEVKSMLDFDNVVVAESEEAVVDADANPDVEATSLPAQNNIDEEAIIVADDNGDVSVDHNVSATDLPKADAAPKEVEQVNPQAAMIEAPLTQAPELQVAVASNSNNNDVKAKGANASQSEEFSIVESVKVETIADSDTNPEMQFSFDEQSNDEAIDVADIEKPKQGINVEKPHSASAKVSDVKMTDEATSFDKEDVNSVVGQIKTAVQNVSNVNGKKITMTLNPESLGKVEVELTMKAGNITAIKITAEKDAINILEKNAQTLQEALKEVHSANDASLSFNLKEGSQNSDEQQKANKTNQFLAELQSDDAKVVVSKNHTDIYDVKGDTDSTVNMKL